MSKRLNLQIEDEFLNKLKNELAIIKMTGNDATSPMRDIVFLIITAEASKDDEVYIVKSKRLK